MRIFLWGMMGSGKTTLGKLFEKEIKRLRFLDLDEEIEKETSLSIPEIFRIKGESYFRKVEAHLLRDLTLNNDDFVMSTGGGTPCFFDNWQFMYEKGFTVYLKVPVEVLADRLYSERSSRPLIADVQTKQELIERLSKLLEEREPYYLQAHIIWDYDKDFMDLINKFKIMLGC